MENLLIENYVSSIGNIVIPSTSQKYIWKSNVPYSFLICDLGNIYEIHNIEINLANNAVFYISSSDNLISWSDLYECPVEKDCINESIRCNARFIRITYRKSKCNNFEIKHVNISGNRCICVESGNSGYQSKDIIKSEGFSFCSMDFLYPGYNFKIAKSDIPGSYFVLPKIKFDSTNLQILLGFSFDDKKLLHRLNAEIEIRLDSINGKLLSSGSFFRQWKEWTLFLVESKRMEEAHDIYFILKNIEENQALEFCWIGQGEEPVLPHPLSADIPYDTRDQKLISYFGLLHSHTCLSDGLGTPSEAFRYARDIVKMDFLGITEHGNLMDSFSPEKSRKFKDIEEISKAYTEDGKFVAIYGSETTWYNQFGHMNIYDERLFFSASEIKYNNIPLYYEKIKQYPKSINQWNHPWSCGNRHLDYFTPYDKKLDDVMYLMEINPYEDPDNHGMNYYIKALDLGWHISPCGSQDNHHADWGSENDLRTVILSEELSYKALVNAIRLNRVCFTCAPYFSVSFSVNGCPMGSRIKRNSEYIMEVSMNNINGKNHLRKVEVITEGGLVLKTRKLTGLIDDVNFIIRDQFNYFFIRAELENGTFSITSPVWIER